MERKSNISVFDTFKNKSSMPIPIPKKLSGDSDDNMPSDCNQYSLNLNIFNPGNLSPPDPWKGRLETRLRAYNATCNK